MMNDWKWQSSKVERNTNIQIPNKDLQFMKDLFIIIWLRFQTQSSFFENSFWIKTMMQQTDKQKRILGLYLFAPIYINVSLWLIHENYIFLSVACQKSSLYQHKQSQQILTGLGRTTFLKVLFFHTSWAFSHMIRLRPLAAQHLPLAQFGAHEISWGHRSSSPRRPV